MSGDGAAQPDPGTGVGQEATAGRVARASETVRERPRRAAEQPDPGPLATLREREAAEARLRAAVADELLTLEEFGDRIQGLLESRTSSEVQQVVADLPPSPRERASALPAPAPATRPARAQGSIVAILSESRTTGRWRPEPTISAFAMMGTAVVDLRDAEYEGDELLIHATALMGSVEIIVPEGVEVELSGLAILGARELDIGTDHIDPHAPVVHVRGNALMGEVEIRNPKPKDGRVGAADRVPLRSRAYDPTVVRHRRRVGQWVKRTVVGLVAAAALLLPASWIASADRVTPSIFGRVDHAVSAVAVSDGEETVAAPIMFGSATIRVPEGVNVEQNGVIIFGSTECEACGVEAAAQPVVRIRTLGAFGSVDIVPNTPG